MHDRSLTHYFLHLFADSVFSRGHASILQCKRCLHITANLYIGKLFEVSDIFNNNVHWRNKFTWAYS
jgi:hypothetical protein